MEMGKLSPLRGKKDFFENPQTLEQARLVGCINISHIYWKDEHYVHADAWDTDLYISDEKICKSGMKKSDIEYVGIDASAQNGFGGVNRKCYLVTDSTELILSGIPNFPNNSLNESNQVEVGARIAKSEYLISLCSN